ncbi:MAG: hypothetical protein PHT69_04410 [Bacteroidales bacterium]|nr:hypothetical protein [Bacteroidales bacterium]
MIKKRKISEIKSLIDGTYNDTKPKLCFLGTNIPVPEHLTNKPLEIIRMVCNIDKFEAEKNNKEK